MLYFLKEVGEKEALKKRISFQKIGRGERPKCNISEVSVEETLVCPYGSGSP